MDERSPAVCRKGCGFYASVDGMCSMCSRGIAATPPPKQSIPSRKRVEEIDFSSCKTLTEVVTAIGEEFAKQPLGSLDEYSIQGEGIPVVSDPCFKIPIHIDEILVHIIPDEVNTEKQEVYGYITVYTIKGERIKCCWGEENGNITTAETFC